MFTKNRPWYLFWAPSTFWITVSPNVYYPENIQNFDQWRHLVAHEIVHLKQQIEHNKYLWFFKYIFWPPFRSAMEYEAMGMQAYILRAIYCQPEINIQIDIQKNATLLTSSNYLWAVWNTQTAVDNINKQYQLLIKNPPIDPFNGMFK